MRMKVKQLLLLVDEWEDEKPDTYTFTKSAGPQFNLLPEAEPMDYFMFQ